jgi:hypothetical protein
MLVPTVTLFGKKTGESETKSGFLTSRFFLCVHLVVYIVSTLCIPKIEFMKGAFSDFKVVYRHENNSF